MVHHRFKKKKKDGLFSAFHVPYRLFLVWFRLRSLKNVVLFGSLKEFYLFIFSYFRRYLNVTQGQWHDRSLPTGAACWPTAATVSLAVPLVPTCAYTAVCEDQPGCKSEWECECVCDDMLLNTESNLKSNWNIANWHKPVVVNGV